MKLHLLLVTQNCEATSVNLKQNNEQTKKLNDTLSKYFLKILTYLLYNVGCNYLLLGNSRPRREHDFFQIYQNLSFSL